MTNTETRFGSAKNVNSIYWLHLKYQWLRTFLRHMNWYSRYICEGINLRRILTSNSSKKKSLKSGKTCKRSLKLGKTWSINPIFPIIFMERGSWKNPNLQEGKSLRKPLSTSNPMFSSTINDKFEEW